MCGTHLRNHQTLSARISLDIRSSYSWQSGWFCQQPRPREKRILIAAPAPARGWGIWVCAAGPGAPSGYCNPFAFRRAARPDRRWMAHSYRSDPRKKHEEHFINLWRVYEHCVNALCPKRAREYKRVLYVSTDDDCPDTTSTYHWQTAERGSFIFSPHLTNSSPFQGFWNHARIVFFTPVVLETMGLMVKTSILLMVACIYWSHLLFRDHLSSLKHGLYLRGKIWGCDFMLMT